MTRSGQHGNGTHVGFVAPTRDAVDAFFKAAMAAGATTDGDPGHRHEYGEPYYGCFVRDPEGHKIEATFWDMELAKKLGIGVKAFPLNRHSGASRMTFEGRIPSRSMPVGNAHPFFKHQCGVHGQWQVSHRGDFLARRAHVVQDVIIETQKGLDRAAGPPVVDGPCQNAGVAQFAGGRSSAVKSCDMAISKCSQEKEFSLRCQRFG